MIAGSAGSRGVSSIRGTPFCHATLPAYGWELTPRDPATPHPLPAADWYHGSPASQPYEFRGSFPAFFPRGNSNLDHALVIDFPQGVQWYPTGGVQ